jgi:sec-independent protein translocase protein TatA
MGGFGAPEIILIIVAILILFGGRKIPELMKGLGQGVKEFKDASNKDTTAKTTTTEEKSNV